jgi:TIR domain-containing protein
MTMARDVFVSHATEDETTASEVCALLEARGVQCWIAPRDVAAGKSGGNRILSHVSAITLY